MAKALSTIGILLRRLLFAVVASTILLSLSQLVDAEQVTFIAGGDVEWSRVVKAPEIYFHPKKRNKWERIWYSVTRKMGVRKCDWHRVPYLATPQSKAYLEKKFNRQLETSKSHHINAMQYGLEFSSLEESMFYPFQKIRPVLLEADIAFANLETPLSDNSRYRGKFRTPTAFAKALKWAGIDVVSTANNHALDAEGAGLLETQEALLQVDVGAVGSGRNLADARRPFIIKRKGITVGFLGYSQHIIGGATGFALPDRSGVVPLDPFLIKNDIQRLREQVNFIILSFHWGWENDQYTHPNARKFAHAALDAGADVILGHHPHVPCGIEVYKGKVIIYSLGNFIFGHNHENWMDNYLARLTFAPDQIEKIEIIPISGKGRDLAQPHVLKGELARTLLRNIQILTEELNTEMQIEGDMGVVILRTNTNRETVHLIDE
jgi:poly-gamma-glutamate synthesis protein (capsule biosynthesis protein)